MDSERDTYLTLDGPSEAVVYKERKSKFIGYAFPLVDEAGVAPAISGLQREHPAASHACYAWQTGIEQPLYRVNDDGEPANSAGMPIYRQIQAFGLTNVLVVVVRIYGGRKLGVGGLIKAYRTTAHMALQRTNIVKRTLQQQLVLSFPYARMDKVLRVIRQQQLTIHARNLAFDCSITVWIKNSQMTSVSEIFKGLRDVTVREVS